ncbi:MAG: hypothetical protein ACLUIR_08065 [Faecalibacterium prausnitzii]
MVDLQMFAEGGEGAPALSHAQAQQAIASGTMRADEGRGNSGGVGADCTGKAGRAACTAGTSCAAPPVPGLQAGECRPCPPRPLGAEEAMIRRDVRLFARQELANPKCAV